MADMPIQPQRRIVLPPHRQRARRPRSERIQDWIRHNLFASRGGTLLTVITGGVAGVLLFGIFYFIFVGANWEVITANRWLLFAGNFPHDQAWRLWVSISLVMLAIGVGLRHLVGPRPPRPHVHRRRRRVRAVPDGARRRGDLVIDLVPGRNRHALRGLRDHGQPAS